MMGRRILAGLAGISLVLGFYVHAAAETTDKDAQKYRASIMTSMRGHIGAASLIVRGLVEDRGALQKHATGLANSASELHYVFPEGSDVDDSEALPAIWEQPGKFAAAVKKAEQATENFRKVVAEGGDKGAIGAAFREVGEACSGCHDDFRVDDDH